MKFGNLNEEILLAFENRKLGLHDLFVKSKLKSKRRFLLIALNIKTDRDLPIKYKFHRVKNLSQHKLTSSEVKIIADNLRANLKHQEDIREKYEDRRKNTLELYNFIIKGDKSNVKRIIRRSYVSLADGFDVLSLKYGVKCERKNTLESLEKFREYSDKISELSDKIKLSYSIIKKSLNGIEITDDELNCVRETVIEFRNICIDELESKNTRKINDKMVKLSLSESVEILSNDYFDVDKYFCIRMSETAFSDTVKTKNDPGTAVGCVVNGVAYLKESVFNYMKDK